jgi:hypothetical protein
LLQIAVHFGDNVKCQANIGNCKQLPTSAKWKSVFCAMRIDNC